MVFLARIGSVKKRLFALFFLLFTVGIASADLVVGPLSQSPANPVAPGTTVVYSFSVGSTLPALPVVPISSAVSGISLQSDLIDDDKKHEDRRGNTFNLSINTGSALDKRRMFLAPPECTQQARSINVFKCKLEPGEKTLYKFSHAIGENEEGFSASFRVNCDDFEGDLKNICTVSGMNPQKINTKVGDAPTPGTVEFSAATYSVKESEGEAMITVRRTGGSDGEVSISYATSSGSATAGSDYTETSGILSWKAGDNEDKSFTIPVADDKLEEGIETVALTLSTLNKSTILGKLSKATLSIEDSTVLTPGKLEFSSATYSVKEGDGTATITVERIEGSDGEVSVSYATSAGTATAGSDYTETSGTLTWQDGDSVAKNFTILVTSDNLKEDAETVSLALSKPTGGEALNKRSQATLSIVDSTVLTPGVLEFDSADYSVKEVDGEVTITVQRVGGSDGEVRVGYATSGGSATAGSDYIEASGTLTWRSGDLADKNFVIQVATDEELEGTETVSLMLKGEALGERSQVTLNIENSSLVEAAGMFKFSAATYTVEENAKSITITVERVGGSDGIVSVQYESQDGDAMAVSDYQAASGRLTWADGDAENKSFTINVVTDSVVEENESLQLSLSMPEGGAALGSPRLATLDIINRAGTREEVSGGANNIGVLKFKKETFWALEEKGKAMVAVTRSGGSRGEVSVTVEIDGGTALDNNVLTWTDGESVDKTLEISIQQGETEKPVKLLLVNATGGVRIDDTREVTLRIVDNASGFSKEQPKLDDKQQVIAEVLDKSCASLDDGEIVELKDQDKLELCVALTESADDLPSLQNALQQLSPEKVIAQAKSSVEALNVQNNNISSRISALRMGVRGLSINQLSLSVDGQQLSGALFSSLLPYAQGGGASADGFSKFGFFSNGTIALGDSEGSANQSGYDFSTKGVTFGVDYRYRSDLVMGVAVGVADTRADIDGNSGEMRINNNSLSLYGSYYQNSQFYLDGIVNFGWSRLDSMRKIEISTINQIAEGETNGNEYSLGVSSGYDFAHKGLSFGPYGSFNYVVANIDGYDERSSDGSSSAVLLAIGEQKVTSMSSALGAQASYAISTQKGVFIPKLSFDWEREYKDDSRLITARFLNDTSNTIFSVSTDEPDRSYFNMNIGFSAVLSQGRSGFVNYSQVIGRDKIKTYSLSGGVRLEF
ncbi:MAG: autotransporter domain-containing protein [Gammaproteobacteria bacterium]|nr:autotransporter domain-containing protein [Gammaproteobacteria bacterium]